MKILILFVLLFPLVTNAASLSGSKPNIIVMMTDDQGYGPVGKHGHPWIQTPNLDRMHDASLRFDRFLVSPTCSPTRAAMMSGRHPMKNGITHTILERERMALGTETLPQVLKKAGYTTGIFGKWHLGDEEEYQPHKRGFDEAFIHGAGGIGQAYKCSCADAPGNKYFDPVIRHNGSFVKTKGYCTDLFFTAALGWIKEVKDNDAPFFAYITTNAPHSPFIAPPTNTKRFKDLGFKKGPAGFYGMIENIDENFGRLLDKAEAWKLLDNTLIIFMSDNGMTGGGSGKGVIGNKADGQPMEAFNAGMKGLKASTDEGGVRVPFFMRWDGKVKAGEVDRVAAHIDLMPTLVDLAGGELPAGQIEGRSLLPLVENPKAEWADRFLFTHLARWKTGEDPDKSKWGKFAVRNQRFRMVGEKNLYDMENDPGQKQNVIEQHPEVVKEMRAAYEEFWAETKPLMVNESAPMSPVRPFHVLYEKQMAAGGIPEWEPPMLQAGLNQEQVMEEAIAWLEQFVQIESWEERVSHVRDPERIRPLMEKYHAGRKGGALSQVTIDPEVSFIRRGAARFLLAMGQLEEGKKMIFLLEHVGGESGFLVDWEVLVNYEPLPWEQFRKEKSQLPSPFRVRVSKGDYYNKPFMHSERYACFELKPLHRERSVYGFVEKNSEIHQRLAGVIETELSGGKAMILTLSYPVNSKFDNLLNITEIVSDSWLLE